MAPRTLAEPYQKLMSDIVETMLAGNGGQYPKSHSDMNYCIRGLLKMYDVKRRPLAIDLPYADEAVEQSFAADGVVGSPVYGSTSHCSVCKKRIVYSEDGWLHCEPQDHGLARPDEDIQNPPRR